MAEGRKSAIVPNPDKDSVDFAAGSRTYWGQTRVYVGQLLKGTDDAELETTS